MRLTAAQLAEYEERGILIIDTGIPESLLDAVTSSLAGCWDGSEMPPVSYVSTARVQDAWQVSDPVWRVAVFRPVLQALAQIYGAKPLPFQTLNFPKGTQQPAHADSIHFNSKPFGMMCGVWVALEDIGPDQGPLVYYPGSHKLPEMNFEDLGLEPRYSEYQKYESKIAELVHEQGLQAEYGIIRKGQAVIWAANVLHGGSVQNNPALSRHSQVTHYYFPGCTYWRPGFVGEEGMYFRPNWLPRNTAHKWLRQMTVDSRGRLVRIAWRRLRRILRAAGVRR